jgi:hypothetical protein
MRFVLLQDRDFFDAVPEDYQPFLERLGLTKTVNVKRLVYCGLATIDETVFVILPRNSLQTIDDVAPDSIEAATLLVKALSKYQASSTLADLDLQTEEDNASLNRLASILWLLKDYVANGLYQLQGTQRKINRGKIDWSRTLTTEVPFLDKTGAATYLKFHSLYSRPETSTPVAQIHAQVIRDIAQQFSWLVTGDPATDISRDIAISESMRLHSTKSKVAILKTALHTTFLDRHIRLLKWLISYLENSSGAQPAGICVGTSSFEGVWEEMLRQIFPSVIKVNSKLPRPAYFVRGSDDPVLKKGMVTDIVIKEQDQLAVIDAKYYSGASPKSSPTWPDVLKQFFYAQAVSNIFPKTNVHNWFIFPGAIASSAEGAIEKVDILMPASGQPAFPDMAPIRCRYLDSYKVMKLYVEGRTLPKSVCNVFLSTDA